MKKEMLLIIAAFFLMSLTAITGVYAIEEHSNIVTLAKEETDVTGDGKEEVIILKGVPYQQEESFLEEIYIEISASNGQTYTFPLESGTKASLQLADLNQDGLKDIFASVLTSGNEETVNSYSYSLKNFKKKQLAVPEPLEMESHFINGYQAEIKLAKTGKSYRFDLKDRKKYYKKMGLYYNEKLNEPTELSVNPYNRLQPVKIAGNKVGLMGEQRVTGIANADVIASVKSTWVFENSGWKLLSSTVKKDLSE